MQYNTTSACSFSGNKDVLACDNDPEEGFWGKLLRFYNKRGCVVEAKDFPRRHRDVHFFEELYTSTNWDEPTLPPRMRRGLARRY